MIEGLSHITFIVRDLDRMTQFLTHIFGAKEVYASGSETFSISREKFFLINQLWIAIMEGEPLFNRSYRVGRERESPSASSRGMKRDTGNFSCLLLVNMRR